MSLCATCRAHVQRALRTLTTKHTVNFHRRHLSTSPSSSNDNNKAHTFSTRNLGDFYTDLLAKPLPSSSPTTPEPALPDWVASRGRQDIEERAAKLFGSIEGSGYVSSNASASPDATWQTINGVPIPPRPLEPDNCCMSGCVNCVWDDYRVDVEAWAARLREAQARGPAGSSSGKMTPKSPVQMHRPEVSASSLSMDDDGGGSEALWDSPSTVASGEVSADELFAEIPVGIREFMASEKRIRERKRARRKETESAD